MNVSSARRHTMEMFTFESSTSRRHWTCTCGCAANAPSCRNFDWRCADKSGTWFARYASPCAVSTTSDAWNLSNKFYSETIILYPWTDRSHRPRRGPRLQDWSYYPRPLRYLLLVLQININTQDHLYINYNTLSCRMQNFRYRVLAVRRDTDSSVLSHLCLFYAVPSHTIDSLSLTRTLHENIFFSPLVFVTRTRRKKKNAVGSRELYSSIRIDWKV